MKYDVNDDCCGANIKSLWDTCSSMTVKNQFDLDRLLYIFVDYCETIGWENVKLAYHEIQNQPSQDTNKEHCYILFTSTLQKYAPNGEHVEDFMKPGEKEVVYNYYGFSLEE